jgi:hypothetical protein
VLRFYSSHTGCCGPQAADCSVQIPSLKIGPAVVHGGVAFWALNHGVLGVRVDKIDEAAATEMRLKPYHRPHYWPDNRLLGISSDNRLFFMYVSVRLGRNMTMVAKLVYFDFAQESKMRSGPCVIRNQC